MLIWFRNISCLDDNSYYHKQWHILCNCFISIFLATWIPQHKISGYILKVITKQNALCFQTATLLLVFASIAKVKMLLYRLCRDYGCFSYRSSMILSCVFYLICQWCFLYLQQGFAFGIDSIRYSRLRAGKLVSCQKTEMLSTFVLASFFILYIYVHCFSTWFNSGNRFPTALLCFLSFCYESVDSAVWVWRIIHFTELSINGV